MKFSKILFFIAIPLLTAVCLSSCEKKDKITPMIIPQYFIYYCEYEAGAGSFEYRIENPRKEVPLNVSTSEKWLTASVNGNTINFSYTENGSKEERFAIIILKYDGAHDIAVSVHQNGKPEIKPEKPVIVVPSTSQTEDATEHEFDIAYSITNPVDMVVMKAESDKEWLTVIRVRDKNIHCSIKENTDSKEREAKITLSYPDAENVVVTVKQTCKQ